MAQGPTFETAFSLGGPLDEDQNFGRNIATDAAGNVYVVGDFSSTVDFDPGPGNTSLTPNGAIDIFIAKYDAAGNFVWVKQIGGALQDFVFGVATDPAGNVYTTGIFRSGPVDFDPGPGVLNFTATGDDIFVQKLNTLGDLVWAKQLVGTSTARGQSVKVDNSGNVYVGGSFQGSVDFDPSAGGTTTFASLGSNDAFVQKLNPSGDLIWAKSFGGTNNDVVTALTVDGSGNVISTGYFAGLADFDPGTGTFFLSTGGSTDIFIQKLDASGNFWFAKGMGSGGNDQGLDITVDATENIYTTGLFLFTVDFDPSFGFFPLTSTSGQSAFIQKLDFNGTFIWAGKLDGTGSTSGYSISLDNFGNIITSGIFANTVDFDPGPGIQNRTTAGLNDIYVSKLDPSGNFLWAEKFGGPSQEFAWSTALDLTGNIYTTGYFLGTVDFDHTGSIFNLTSNGTTDIFVQKMNEAFPSITSFTPGNGTPGTTVTISGTNFSTTPSANVVRFNGVLAVATGSTATTVTVTVPGTATTGKITLAVNGNIAISPTDFTVNSCLPAIQRAALVALYNSTSGATWGQITNWFGSNEAAWYGVTVTGCQVTNIDLYANNLFGTLPPEIGDLTNLVELDVSYNALSGSLPATIGNLSNLEILDASNNNTISGTLPLNINNMSSLRILHMRANQLSGSIPAAISACTNLEDIQLDNNQLTGSIPTSMGALTNLTIIDIGFNLLTGSIPTQLGNLTSLIYLALAGNTLSGAIPKELGSLTNLRQLALGQNLLTGVIPSELGNMSSLLTMNLSSNQLTGSIPSALGNLSVMTDLNIGSNLLSGTVPAGLSGMTQIRNLNLSDNQLTGDFPPSVGVISTLDNLYINDNQLVNLPTLGFLNYADVRSNKLTFEDIEPNEPRIYSMDYSPQDDLPGGTITINEGDALTIPFSTGGTANQYKWYKNGALIAGATSASFAIPIASLADAGDYVVKITNTIAGSLTLASDPFVVTVDPAVNISIATANLTAPVGGSVTIDITSLVTTITDPLEITSINVLIQPVSGAVASITNGVLLIDYTGLSFNGTDTLTIEACDVAGSCAQQEITVLVTAGFTVYNAMSPNGDGKNEVFLLDFIDLSPDTKTNKVTIFNRTGQVVFQETDYDNVNRVFKGLNDGGDPLPSGTYFYRVDFTSGLASKTGFISLRK